MDRNGQLKFSDDPLLTGGNESYRLIEEGRFVEAVKKLDDLLTISPDYPGLGQGYRTARFWNNRRKEIINLKQGKQTADFLMNQWGDFENYAKENGMLNSTAYRSAMKFVFFTASKHYKIAFQTQESAIDNFDLLLNLGMCFLTLGEYSSAIETLEYARSSYKSSARLLAILGESYFHTGEIPKSLLLFKEAFFINPSEIDISYLKAAPIIDLIEIVRRFKPDCNDVREWIPIFGFLEGVFYARRQLNTEQQETIKQEIYSLEKNFQTISKDRIQKSNIIPRLINKYLWMLEFFKFQKYDLKNITEINERLICIDKDIFEKFFEHDEDESK